MKRITIAAGVWAVVVVLGTGMLASCTNPEKLCAELETGARPDQAREKLEKITARDPSDLRSQSWLVILCSEQGEYVRAREVLDQLEAKAPADYLTLTASCTLEAAQKNWPEASSICKKALEASSRSARDLNLAAAAELMYYQFSAAKALLDEGLIKFPDDPNLRTNLGFYHLKRQNFTEAIEAFKQAVARDPSNIVARKNLAGAYFETQNFAGAVLEQEEILKLGPDDSETLINLAFLYAYFVQDKDKAKSYAQKALDHHPEAAQETILKDIVAGQFDEVPVSLRSSAPLGTVPSPGGPPVTILPP